MKLLEVHDVLAAEAAGAGALMLRARTAAGAGGGGTGSEEQAEGAPAAHAGGAALSGDGWLTTARAGSSSPSEASDSHSAGPAPMHVGEAVHAVSCKAMQRTMHAHTVLRHAATAIMCTAISPSPPPLYGVGMHEMKCHDGCYQVRTMLASSSVHLAWLQVEEAMRVAEAVVEHAEAGAGSHAGAAGGGSLVMPHAPASQMLGQVSRSSSSSRGSAMQAIPEDELQAAEEPGPRHTAHGRGPMEPEAAVDMREAADSVLQGLQLPASVSQALADVLPVLPMVEHGQIE